MLKFGILDVNGTKHNLKLGQEYFLGRKTNEYTHDIEIDDKSVDIKHAIIDLTHNLPQLFDISSKNGTFVDGLKAARFQSFPLSKTSKIRFGNVEACIQLLFEGDSGFLEERPNSPKDTSDIICGSPELIVPSGSRLKNSLKNSLTSTPNPSINTSLTNAPKPVTNFLLPSCAPRTSTGSNTSACSVDSFNIPETQHATEHIRRSANSTDISIYSNRSKRNSTVGDDDFCIPETQEVITAVVPLQNHARVAFPSDDVNETFSQEDKIPSSQFRICTQDFNGSDEEETSNQSDDILANVPSSMIIPPIQHTTVQIDDFMGFNEDDVEKEMSALQWSKKTLEDASVTPDDILNAFGTVTSTLIAAIRKSSENAPSESSTPDIFVNPEEPKALETTSNTRKTSEEVLIVAKEANDLSVKVNEPEFQPTQVFIKPMNNSITKPSLPPVGKENNGPADFCDSLPPTQVFVPPLIKPKPVMHSPSATKLQTSSPTDDLKLNNSTKSSESAKNHVFAMPQPSPKPKTKQASPKTEVSPKVQVPPVVNNNDDDDDLPPTQVFLKDDYERVPPQITSKPSFSSTLVDCGFQLSENSFKAKCNKLLDSDDDEMDEIIAPELVKQMRQSLENPPLPKEEIIEKGEEPAGADSKEKKNENEASMTTPENKNFVVPVNVPKKNYSKTPAISIDNFLLTPDFLGKEFSKDLHLQKQAEMNWKNMVSEKQRQRSLFGDDKETDEHEESIESDDSGDSFVDLLPKKRETRSKSVNRDRREKVEKPKVEKEIAYGRVTRRRATLAPDVKKVSEKESSKKESKTRGRKKKDEDIKEAKDPDLDKVGKEAKVVKQPQNVKDPKEQNSEVGHLDKVDKEANVIKEKKDKKDSKNKKDPKSRKDDQSKKETSVTKDQIADPVKSTSLSSLKDSLQDTNRSKDSPLINASNQQKSAIPSKVQSLTKELSSHKNSSAIKESPRVSREEPSFTAISTNEGQIVVKSNNFNTSEEPKEKHESSKKNIRGRPRTRLRVEEPTKVEEKSVSSRGVKRNVEVKKSSSRASKINKLEGLGVESKNISEKPATRVTRLKSSSDLEVEENKTRSKNQAKKEAVKNEDPKEKVAARLIKEQTIDLTDSDADEINHKKVGQPTKKRKSQEEELVAKRSKSTISTSQSSAESTDSDRTLRRKKKIKIAMTSCSPATRATLVRYTGRIWDYTEDPKECDVLIVEAGNRTYKLLVAIARGVPVVRVNWLKEVIQLRTTEVLFEKHLFDDPNFQKRHHFVMRDVLQSARSKALFLGMNFMMTPNIIPNPDEMKDIIACAGGTVLTDNSATPDIQPLYLVSENVDSKYWHKYRRVYRNIQIVTAIALMSSVMQQSLDALIKSIH